MKFLSFTFVTFLLFRLSSVLFVQTSYVADEYWQSLEIAHKMTFGYGYVTWEWKEGIRSYFYPFIISIFYKVLKYFSIDSVTFIVFLPKVLQAVVTSVSDQYFYLLCHKFSFNSYWSKIAVFTNWFWYFCGMRTISNTFETCLTIIALYYYPWNLYIKKTKNNVSSWDEVQIKSIIYLSYAVINCLVRPTAATIWIPLIMSEWMSLYPKYCLKFTLHCIVPVILIICPIFICIDCVWYGKFIIPSYKFALLNLYKGISSFYGTHSYYWYFTQGIPAVFGLHLLPIVLGILSIFSFDIGKTKNQFSRVFLLLIIIIVLNILILSSIPHKEFRFLLPLFPLMMLFEIKFCSEFFTPSKRKLEVLWSWLLIITFIIPSFLFGSLHQRGTLAVMEYLQSETTLCKSKCSFLFLMPCHSTPLYSHLHVNVTTKFLECEPPLTDNSYDESEDFFNNPSQWLKKYWEKKNIPTHVILFNSIEKSVGSFLESKQFKQKLKIFNTVFEERKHYILVYSLS